MARSYSIESVEDVNRFCRGLTNFCKASSLSDDVRNRSNLVARELLTNLHQHSESPSHALFGLENFKNRTSIVLATSDSGPGFDREMMGRDKSPSFEETLGIGFGVIHRNSDLFSYHSDPETGTIFVTRFDEQPETDPSDHSSLDYSVINVPRNGEEVSGDDSAVIHRNGRLQCFLVDGIGHGPVAHSISEKAVKFVKEYGPDDPATTLNQLDKQLQRTRGCVASITEIHPEEKKIRFAGIGDTLGVLYNNPESKQSLTSLQGTLGNTTPTIRTFSYDISPGSVIILHTDGIESRWKLAEIPGVFENPPLLLSAYLTLNFRRGRDDSCVIAIQCYNKSNDQTV